MRNDINTKNSDEEYLVSEFDKYSISYKTIIGYDGDVAISAMDLFDIFASTNTKTRSKVIVDKYLNRVSYSIRKRVINLMFDLYLGLKEVNR